MKLPRAGPPAGAEAAPATAPSGYDAGMVQTPSLGRSALAVALAFGAGFAAAQNPPPAPAPQQAQPPVSPVDPALPGVLKELKSLVADPGFGRHVFKFAIAKIAIEFVRSKTSYIKIVVAVIVEIGD